MIKKVFKSTSKNVCFTFAHSNKKIQFLQGVYFTDVPQEIAALEHEIQLGHPMFYIDPDESEIDTEAEAKARQKLKDEAVAEYLASQAALKDTRKDMGTTTQEQIKPAGTDKLAMLIAGSTSGSPASTPTPSK